MSLIDVLVPLPSILSLVVTGNGYWIAHQNQWHIRVGPLLG